MNLNREALCGAWGDPAEHPYDTVVRLAAALGVEPPTRKDWEEWPMEAEEPIADVLAKYGLFHEWVDGEIFIGDWDEEEEGEGSQ